MRSAVKILSKGVTNMLNDLYKKIAKKPTALEQHKLNIEQPFKNVDEIMNITSTKKQSTGKKKLRLGL